MVIFFLSTKEKKLMPLLSKNCHGTHKKNMRVLKEGFGIELGDSY